MEYRQLIEEFRKNNDTKLLKNFKCKHNGKDGYDYSFDKNYLKRK